MAQGRDQERVDMRLICPNCSAQYEIDKTLVPEEGRDVQCSNCGHTWFELPPAAKAALSGAPALPPESDEEEAQAEADPEETASDQEDASEATETSADADQDTGPSHAALAMEAASEDAAEDDDVYEGPADPQTPTPPLPPKRPADVAALDILKEEAEREMSRRRAPPSDSIETQTEMGLDDIRKSNTPSRALKARMASMKQDDPDDWPKSEAATVEIGAEVVSDGDYQAPRRDLLPDIDEINSTLKSTRRRTDAGTQATAGHQRGFRTGFLAMAILAVAMIFAYAQAPAIARALPGSESALIPYVDGANAVRDWIDGILGNTDG